MSLEFDVVLRLLSSLARTDPGRRVVSRLAPSGDEASVRALLSETSEVWSFRIRHGRLPLAGAEEIEGPLATIESGAFGPEDFRPVLSVARATAAVRRALEPAESPRLVERRERLPHLDELLAQASRIFAADGTIRDDASPELSAIRTRLRRRRNEVARNLEKIVDQRREFLGDATVVLRNDRYCLPVLASSRARVPGMVHDRSGSGQTVFVEPMEVIEANNDLALLAGEERREVERLLTGFGRSVLAAAEPLGAAVGELAELDALEAKVEFGDLSEGRVPEISDDGEWILRAARHPLLDARLAPLRRRVLDEHRGDREAVPLDLELTREQRMLVVSGPNAGGKTVVLKTAGLFSLLAQSGIPIPAGTGTRVPVFRAIRTEIGDAQAILSDRSTFSSSMETLAAILQESGPGVLALIDEIGGATDPEEGSALAVAFLEEYLARGGRAIVTTHLSAIKNFAAGRTDAVTAAMEFDEETGRPNYRLHPGLSGRSRALSVARERGLPSSVLDRAVEILGEAWQRREERESEAEAALDRLRRAEAALLEEREKFRRDAEKLAAEKEEVARSRSKLRDEGLAGFEKARRELARRVDEELSAIRGDAARRSETSAAQLVAEAERAVAEEPALVEAREQIDARARTLEEGGRARMRGMKLEGTIVSLDPESAWLDVAGKRMRVSRSELEPAGAGAAWKREPSDQRERDGRGTPRSTRSGNGKRKNAAKEASSADPSGGPVKEVNVIGKRLDEAIDEVEKALDEALVAGARLRVIHGHGTGRLRDGLREHLRKHPNVASARAADAREGGNGATMVELQ
ncbi:MAG: Smr/MutS family protein [Acidobacteriota bacterium]|nr:Smr/MutS family protein [Acidobacteriota bacterium]